MISACEVDKIIKDKLTMQTQMQDEIDMSVDELDGHNKKHNRLENRIFEIEEALNKNRLELLLEKGKKQPQLKCLPDTNCSVAQIIKDKKTKEEIDKRVAERKNY